MRMLTLVAVAATAALLAAGAASASRAPTPLERQALAGLVATWLAGTVPQLPIGCLDPRFAVATVDARFAVTTRVLSLSKLCDRYRWNGIDVLRRDASGWRIDYEGSDPPFCVPRHGHFRGDGSDIPAAVVRDLFGTSCLK